MVQFIACNDATINECIEALCARKIPLITSHTKDEHDVIEEQTLVQIKRIGAIGRSVA